MFHYLHLRSRFLQTLILALIGLTFYAYYRTAVYDVRQYSLPRNANYSTYQDGLHLNLSQARNSSSDSMSVSSYTAHNSSNSSSIFITTLSTSSSAQSLSLSSSVSTVLISSKQSANEKLQTVRVINVTKSTPIAVRNDSARAIYKAGHIVSIPERCPNLGKDMDLVVIVMSAPTHIEARTAIRQTWGHYGQRSDMSVLFMLGITLDPRVETICSKVKYLLKTDDDMFINVPRLLAFVYKHVKDRNVIFGRLARKWKPIRNHKSKYYVSQAQFQQSIFPDFTTGPAYLLSSDTVHRLYDAALDQTYLKLEDVFTTGIVAHRLGIRRSHANEFLNKRIQYTACNIQRGISIHMVKYSEQFDLWKKLLDGKSKCK